MDELLFYEYLSVIFLPYVTAVRSRLGLEDQPAVLLMDSALPHVSERVGGILGENDVIAITFPAHTRNVFQALDLVFFGALKKLKATATGEIDDGSADATILKLIQAYERAAMSATVGASFQEAGFEEGTTTRLFKIRIAQDKLREKPGFQELWAWNI
jgi:hypothetical protein